MKIKIPFISFLLCTMLSFAQKDSLSIGDRYAEDQLYLSVSYSQFFNQPTSITKSNFSYALSTGIIKDIPLNKKGTIAFAAGVGYGYDFFNHELNVTELNGETMFNANNFSSENIYKAHNLEFPLELRWRTSTAKRYNFWRIYTGVKFLYNLSNQFQYKDEAENQFKYTSVSAYNKLQYGLTLSAGYDEFTVNLYYGLTPLFNGGAINGEAVNTKILKFGLIFYFL